MRRVLSVPERLGVLGVGVLAAGAVWPAVTGATGLATPCPLRWLTGVPCPACGLTTSAVALARGDLGAALAANPVIVGIAALALFVGPVLVLRKAGALPPPAAWSARSRSRVGWGVALLAFASWAFQLNRLGVS